MSPAEDGVGPGTGFDRIFQERGWTDRSRESEERDLMGQAGKSSQSA